MRDQLVQAPVELVIANHAMGLWELAVLDLSHKPPHLPQAQLAIDALSACWTGSRAASATMSGHFGTASPISAWRSSNLQRRTCRQASQGA